MTYVGIGVAGWLQRIGGSKAVDNCRVYAPCIITYASGDRNLVSFV